MYKVSRKRKKLYLTIDTNYVRKYFQHLLRSLARNSNVSYSTKYFTEF